MCALAHVPPACLGGLCPPPRMLFPQRILGQPSPQQEGEAGCSPITWAPLGTPTSCSAATTLVCLGAKGLS